MPTRSELTHVTPERPAEHSGLPRARGALPRRRGAHLRSGAHLSSTLQMTGHGIGDPYSHESSRGPTPLLHVTIKLLNTCLSPYLICQTGSHGMAEVSTEFGHRSHKWDRHTDTRDDINKNNDHRGP